MPFLLTQYRVFKVQFTFLVWEVCVTNSKISSYINNLHEIKVEITTVTTHHGGAFAK